MDSFIQDIQWKFLAQGDFNIVLVSSEPVSSEKSGLLDYSGYLVLKICYKPQEPTEEPLRNASLFKRLNPNLPALAVFFNPSKLKIEKPSHIVLKNGAAEFMEFLAKQSFITAWIAPYIQPSEVDVTDDELCDVMARCYLHHEKILVDGSNPTNFIKQENGQLVLIDPGMALHRRSTGMALDHRSKRVSSPTSVMTRPLVDRGDFADRWNDWYKDRPKATLLINALLWLDANEQEVSVVEELPANLTLLVKLAMAYREQREVPPRIEPRSSLAPSFFFGKEISLSGKGLDPGNGVSDEHACKNQGY